MTTYMCNKCRGLAARPCIVIVPDSKMDDDTLCISNGERGIAQFKMIE
jgi:hypothetical protein